MPDVRGTGLALDTRGQLYAHCRLHQLQSAHRGRRMTPLEHALFAELDVYHLSMELAREHLDKCERLRALAKRASTTRTRLRILGQSLEQYDLSHAALDIWQASAFRLTALLTRYRSEAFARRPQA